MTNLKQPLVVSYGVGRDSTALIIELHRRGIRPDAIVFANVGSEKEMTYKFIPVFNAWLESVGFPTITVVKYTPKRAPYHTLEGNMVLNATLPGAALNQHTCAMKFKIEPQNKWARSWKPAVEAWARGQKVLKMIGFEAGETHRLKRADARAHSGKANPLEAKRFEYQMPLMEWGYDLQKCMQIIDDAGLPIPPKSACYFCPFQKTHEVDEATPEDRARTILIELTAEPYNTKVRGLWRRPRKADGRPGSITEYILQKGLEFTPLEEIAEKIVLNPKCQKARNGTTFNPPHVGPTLREILESAGHKVPRVLIDDDGSEGVAYKESLREAPAAIEEEVHAELVEMI
jgi:hypothetical protein